MSKYYYAYLSVIMPSGEKKMLKFYGKTQKEADEKKNKARWEYENGLLSFNNKTPFKRWAEEWLETYQKTTTDAKNYEIICRIAHKTFIDDLGQLAVSEIKPTHLKKCLNKLIGKSKSSVNKAYTFIRSCMETAYDVNIIRVNPAAGLKKPKYEEHSRRALTKKERLGLVSTIGKTKQSLFFAVMFCTGMRPGEVRALTWNDVDLKKDIITVRSAVKEDGRIGSPKTSAGVRIVIIPELLHDLLLAKGRGVGFVFGGSKNWNLQLYRRSWLSFKRAMDQQMGATVYRNQIVVHAVNMGQDISPYYLRHNYATMLAEKGVDIRIISYLMGHSFNDVTNKIYTHLTPEYVETARADINAIFNKYRYKVDTLKQNPTAKAI